MVVKKKRKKGSSTEVKVHVKAGNRGDKRQNIFQTREIKESNIEEGEVLAKRITGFLRT